MINKMNELNRELVLDELSNFERRKSGEIPVILDKYLESIAQNGDPMFSWTKLQPLLRRKLEIVMNEFNQLCPTDHLMPLPNVRPFDFDEMKQQILQAIDSFSSAPFTIQRLCELIINPSKHYKRTDKFMRGIEKNILVVTTIEPKTSDGSSIQYTTSSFKNLFSSLHSTSNSNPLNSSPSTSHLVNGIADVICDQQMALQCSSESSLHSLSSQMTSSINSSSNAHLAPLQQLDSFTTVFATNPSTPLSVVSDLHSYEQSTSLSLHTSANALNSNSNSSDSIEHNPIEASLTAETSANPDIDSPVVSSSSSLQTSTSTDANSRLKDESKPSTSNTLSLDSSKLMLTESNLTKSVPESSESSQLSQIVDCDKTNEAIEANNETDINDDRKCDQSETDASVTSSEASQPTDHTSNDPSVESISGEVPTISDDSKSTSVDSAESPNQKIDSVKNQSDSHEVRVTNDEEMCQPMEFSGNTTNDNNSDMTDCSDKNSDSNLMDDTLSSSDQSEPMDED